MPHQFGSHLQMKFNKYWLQKANIQYSSPYIPQQMLRDFRTSMVSDDRLNSLLSA